MAGNSKRRGAMRKPGSKKGAVTGSGGQRRRGLEGRGPTPKAEDREGHIAAHRGAGGASVRRAAGKDAAGTRTGRGGGRGASAVGRGSSAASGTSGRGTSGRAASTGSRAGGGVRSGPRIPAEVVAGRNAVVEALRAGVPVRTVYVADRVDVDDRVREVLRTAADRGLPLLEAPRAELDRISGRAVHQGVALQVPAYEYAHADDLLGRAADAGEPPLVVALDGVTDPRNLGAVVRSAAAFGAHGVLVPERRAAGVTAGTWKASAGALARVPVAQAVNLARALAAYRDEGLFVAGLSAEGDTDLAELDLATGPLVVVLGSEGRGLSRLVEQGCDVRVRIPMARDVESLNAGVAAGIVLHAVAAARSRS